MTVPEEPKQLTEHVPRGALAAVIYCRVSSTKQTTEGHGLESQESRCREYAQARRYSVEAVFPDDVSGGGDFMKRPGMVALLSYLDAQPDKRYVVIFDDLKRFARDTEFHLKLRQEFRARRARVECLNYKFDDSPEGKFFETILAAQGTLEREQNGRQTAQKMHARMRSGYWVFRPPIGYKFDKDRVHGKILVRDEPLASIVTEALEGYASGRFDSQAEIRCFLENHPTFPRTDGGRVRQQKVTDLLTQPLYAGYLCHDDWKLSWIAGKHEPLISVRTYEAIQERRASGAKAPMRQDLNKDFPLRGFVLCGDCGKPLTACWSKGSTKKYPYYLCDTRGCESYRKSIRRADVEGEFEDILRDLQPTHTLFELSVRMLEDAWQQRTAQAEAMIDSARAELRTIDARIENLLERVVEASSPAVIGAYEAKIESLDRQRRLLDEQRQARVCGA
ncbi:MAG: recombinase family protein [Geminicoccaceae bacterium]|nr:recombinase family protein [Geminicoccaceae bacterium]